MRAPVGAIFRTRQSADAAREALLMRGVPAYHLSFDALYPPYAQILTQQLRLTHAEASRYETMIQPGDVLLAAHTRRISREAISTVLRYHGGMVIHEKLAPEKAAPSAE